MLGLYVHIPFCVHRCSYCDFFSSSRYESDDFGVLVGHLERDLRHASELCDELGKSRELATVFLGGGTPSLLPLPALDRLWNAIGRYFELTSKTEVTSEANPETVTSAWANHVLQHTPIRRISLGAQSFQPKFLATLERRTTPEGVRAAVQTLQTAGLSNLNVDLMFAIPGQTVQDLESDLKAAFSLETTHLSCYHLALKPGHSLYSKLPEDDLTSEMHQCMESVCEANGFSQYEISNFAKAGFECRHNQIYWRGEDFLGVGPSASSRLMIQGESYHFKQPADWHRYREGGGPAFSDFQAWERSDRNQTALEQLFLEIRTRKGLERALFQTRFGRDPRASTRFPLLEAQGYFESDPGFLRLTQKGRMMADTVAVELSRDWA